MRLYITGGPGSGKTRAAARLADCFPVPKYSLDDIVWDNSEGRQNRRFPAAIRDEALARIAHQPDWIAEGTYFQTWVDPLLERTDLVLILMTSRMTRLVRLMKRHFVEQLRLMGPWENVRLFFSTARWGLRYETVALRQLIERLQARGIPFVLHEKGDVIALVTRRLEGSRHA